MTPEEELKAIDEELVKRGINPDDIPKYTRPDLDVSQFKHAFVSLGKEKHQGSVFDVLDGNTIKKPSLYSTKNEKIISLSETPEFHYISIIFLVFIVFFTKRKKIFESLSRNVPFALKILIIASPLYFLYEIAFSLDKSLRVICVFFACVWLYPFVRNW